MKKKTMVVVLVTVFAMVGLLGGIAQAAWMTCTLSYVGSTSTGYLVEATDTAVPAAFTKALFVLNPYSNGKEMYAAALTAFANSTNVQLFVDPPYPQYSIVWGCLATK